MRTVSENVRDLCAERKVSIAKLERESKVANGTIGKWDLTGRKPSLDVLRKISLYFDVPIMALLKGTEYESK